MAVQRMDNVGIVVEDLPGAIAFFTELGLELEGEAEIYGEWAARVVGLPDMRSAIAMMRTPDGHGKVELVEYRQPEMIKVGSPIAVNAQGFHRIMFAVDDLEDTLCRLKGHGAELVGEVSNYEDLYLLCYVRGPEGIVIALAQQLT